MIKDIGDRGLVIVKWQEDEEKERERKKEKGTSRRPIKRRDAMLGWIARYRPSTPTYFSLSPFLLPSVVFTIHFPSSKYCSANSNIFSPDLFS